MPAITRELLRKRAEHNEGILTTLEEVSLHQEELEGINEVLGLTCRRIRILYLQNNLIGKMENLQHLKDLGYLNLALNNITKIEGLHNCEFLHKLDLTVNFIDVDTLEESITHLQSRSALVDLYMVGNPCQSKWPGFASFVIGKLPQLRTLDGQEITRTMQILANQSLPKLEAELRVLADHMRSEAEEKAALCRPTAAEDIEEVYSPSLQRSEDSDPNEMTDNTPEARVKIYKELAQQKKEKADREKANQPRVRDYDVEHADAKAEIRSKEESTHEKDIKQKNEGGWDFRWDEESKAGCIVLEVMLPKHLDSSLIDVDVHPTYVSVIVKSKTLRLRTPAEVKSSDSSCLRSKTTGSLLVTMPKVNAKEVIGIVAKKQAPAASAKNDVGKSVVKATKKLSLQEEAMLTAMESTQSLSKV